MSVCPIRAAASKTTWWAALLVALALAGALTPRAEAVLVHIGHGRVAGVLPVRGDSPASIPGSFAHRHSSAATSSPGANGALSYNGGPVLHAETPYLVFWDPANQISAADRALYRRFFADSAADSGMASNVYAVNRQYTDTTGFADYNQTWTAAQAISDTQVFPSSNQCPRRPGQSACLTDVQLTNELTRLIGAQGLPTGVTALAPIYFIVTPPNVNSCLDASGTTCTDTNPGFCAYHSSFTGGSGEVLYADIPTLPAATSPKGCQADQYPTTVQSPNGNPTADVAIKYISHEYNEIITDPLGTAWFDPTSGNENGDDCNAYSPAPDPATGTDPNAFTPSLGGLGASGTLYDQLMNGSPYYTQSEWSNGQTDCMMQPTASSLNPAFAGPAKAVPGHPVSLDPTGSASSAGFSSTTWTFGDGSAPMFSRAAPTTQPHTYASLGTDTVTLKTVDRFGNLATVSHAIEVTNAAAAFTSSPTAPLTGTNVTFDGSDSAITGASPTYQWSFDDGGAISTAGPSSSPTVTHTFNTPGTDSATLTIDNGTYADSVTKNVTVDPSPSSIAPSSPTPSQLAAPPAPASPGMGTPAATLSVTTAHPIAGAAVAFSGSGSSDRGSTLVAYSWAFGDGSSATGVTPVHAYRRPGGYTVTLTVRDATGATATSSRRIPVPSAGISGVKIKKGKQVERLTVAMSGPGILISGRRRLAIKRAGSLVLTLELTPVQRRRLSSHHAVGISLKLGFRPTVGSSSSRRVKFKVFPV